MVVTLTVAASILAGKDALPFVVIGGLCAVALLLAEWRWLRARLPLGRPLSAQMQALHRRGRAIAADGGAELGRRASEWDRELWRTLERGYDEKGATYHRVHGGIPPDASDELARTLIQNHLHLLDLFMIGKA